MIINIVYRQFFDQLGEKLLVGGVETYIINLIKCFVSDGITVRVFQYSDQRFSKEYEGARIIGVVPKKDPKGDIFSLSVSELVSDSYRGSDLNKDILIFGSDNDIVKSQYMKVIAIQHGIGWDVHPEGDKGGIKSLQYLFKNSVRAYMKYQRYKGCKVVVCVDYNFVNWYRTCICNEEISFDVIPNFSEISEYTPRDAHKTISIIFARRFQKYRGTRVFAEAIIQLLKQNADIEVTIAGEGPDEMYLKNTFKGFSNVQFTSFLQSDSIEIHSHYDIAVIPSTASEGTSLSLLEAMAAGCAVICTDVGGLTNIVLDGFNGLIIKPDAKCLIEALNILINDDAYRSRISKNGYETVKEAFSIDRWKKKWVNVIDNL